MRIGSATNKPDSRYYFSAEKILKMNFSLSKISLRTRLIILTALALIALLIAMLSAFRTARMSASFAERRTEINVQSAARELVRESENIGDLPIDKKGTFPPHVREIMRRYADVYSRSAAVALDRFKEVSGGFCGENDEVISFIAGNEDFSKLAPQQVCRTLANVNDFQTLTMQSNGEDFYVAFAPVSANEKATNLTGVFAFQKLPKFNALSDRFNLITQIFLLLSAIALVAFAFTTFRRWQNGMQKIESGLQEISDDLSNRIDAPKISELDKISREINRLAENLETNLAKQNELEKDLANNEKLAALGRVASGVAHEIRNPLAAMKLKIQMAARQGFDKSKIEKTFAVLNEEIARLDNLISKMLDAGKQKKLTFKQIAPTEILRERLEFIKEKADANNVAIKTEFSAEDLKINADAEKLTQVFDNLLLNALEAMTNGGVLKVRAFNEADKIIYEFADSGAGISPTEKEKIFEPFFTTKDNGTGLGLAISREIIEAHNGRLFLAESENGTKFIVELRKKL